MASAKDKHLESGDIAPYHIEGRKQSQKGCLWRHESDYDENNECSHRWQARQRAESDAQMFDYPAYKSLCVDHKPSGKNQDDAYPTAAYSGPKRDTPKNYAMQHMFPLQIRKRPRPGQWDLKLSHNFKESATKPYWHNAHHIIPLSALHSEIEKAGGNSTTVIEILKKGLMKGEYNLNDKVNMIILPHDRAVAFALGLPRHLKGHESYSYEYEPNKRRETDHPDYTRRVKMKIRSVIDEFKSQIEEPEDCEGEPDIPAFAKKKLEDISEEIYQAIKKAGKYLRGKSLDELKFSNLGGR